MIGYFWPHVFQSGGADRLVVRGCANDQQLQHRLRNIEKRLARNGAAGAEVLQNCPLPCVPVLEVVAEALLDTGAVNSVCFTMVADEDGVFSLAIGANIPMDEVIARAASDWANSFIKEKTGDVKCGCCNSS